MSCDSVSGENTSDQTFFHAQIGENRMDKITAGDDFDKCAVIAAISVCPLCQSRSQTAMSTPSAIFENGNISFSHGKQRSVGFELVVKNFK